jgi:hypothetical protein
MNKGRVYASADWHGCWHVAKKVLDYLQPEDTLYYLGDATDRGESGVKIFQTLISDSRVKMIKGNHDQMMADAIPFVWREIEDINYYGGHGYSLWYQNGGDKTAKDFWKMTKEEVYAIKEAVDKMPTELRYISPTGHTVIIEHAGYTPFDIPHRSHDPLWDREHFHDKWVSGSGASEITRDTYLIHGHTPVQYLKFMYGYNGEQPLTKEEIKQKQEWLHPKKETFDWKPTILRYCDNHKFDLDMCTIASDRIALLNLDTFEEIYFDGEEN